MKKFQTILTAILFASIAQAAFANCDSDVYQMREQINIYESITTPDGVSRFTRVQSPVSTGRQQCAAEGYYMYDHVCRFAWKEGDWGNTFHCVS